MKLPYGYVMNGEEIAIHEKKADVVRSIFECYLWFTLLSRGVFYNMI